MFGLLYVMDALRASELSCYECEIETTPELDAVAADSVRFEQAYATTTWTKPSAATLHTGHYPRTLGVMHEDDRIPRLDTGLASVLRKAGFATRAISANAFFSPYFGFDGFDEFDLLLEDEELLDTRELAKEPEGNTQNRIEMLGVDKPIVPRSADINERLYRALDGRGNEDTFVTAWSVDTHGPYFPREGKTWFGTDPEAFVYERDVSRDNLDTVRSLYREMVRYNDSTIGNLVGELKRRELYDEALLVFVGDHGESLGERFNALGRPEIGHAGRPDEEKIRVPLIVKFPDNAFEGTTVADPVSLVDVYATILDALSVEQPTSVESVSLHPEADATPNPALVESQFKRNGTYWGAYREGAYKYTTVESPSAKDRPKRYIQYLLTRIREGSDRSCSLTEGDPVSDAVHHRLRGTFRNHRRTLQDRRAALEGNGVLSTSDAVGVDDEVRQQLQRLGYFE